jgi:hypothetical protein
MIVQTALPGQPHFVIEQPDHAAACGRLAAVFGNDAFAPPEPRDLVIFTVTHHDEGWVPVDGLAEASPATGLPHHLTQTPLPYLLRTSKGSPDFNEAHHPFCGLLSSMHTVGLFNGRYGLSDFVFIDRVPAEYRAAADALLTAETARQERLKAVLRADPATAAWVEDTALFDNYKRLQFFDTLALYFQLTHAEARRATRFLNVPDGRGTDHTITVTPQPDGTYALSPWCFADDVVEVITLGRYLRPQPGLADFRAVFAATPKEAQRYRLVPGREGGR